MSTESCAKFLERFVLPMVAGGDLHVGAPIDEQMFEELERGLPHASVPLMAIDEARDVVLARLVVSPPAILFGVDELSLAAAVHNLLYLCHPDADGWMVSDSVRAKVVASAQQFAARPRTGNRSRVLARHALLHNFFDISRTDVKVSWWTGSTTFHGQPTPHRLLRWEQVRRVSQEETTVGFRDLFVGAEVAAVIGTLLRRSPLSQLLLNSPITPHLHWEDVVFLLRDSELARVISYSAIVGKSPFEIVETPARLAASFDQMLERSPREQDVRTVAAFLSYLNCLLALDEVHLTEKSPLLATVLGSKDRARGLATFFSVPAALAQLDSALAYPPGLSSDPRLQARWQLHRSQAIEQLGEGVAPGLAARMRRHFGMVESKENKQDGHPEQI